MGTATERAEWKEEKTQLEKRQERLEQDVRDRQKVVDEWGAKLRELTQPGNDFVTRALGHRVVCTWGRVETLLQEAVGVLVETQQN